MADFYLHMIVGALIGIVGVVLGYIAGRLHNND